MNMRKRKYWGAWAAIETAPLDVDVMLLVADNVGEYELPWPCKLTADGWVSCSKGTALLVKPVGWRVADVPRSPAWAAQPEQGKR